MENNNNFYASVGSYWGKFLNTMIIANCCDC